MKIVNGTYTSAKIFTDNIEDYAMAQIKMICDAEAAKGSKIRIMPDVHPGKVGPIGLTMTITDAVMPNIVGIDIGCGISIMKVKTKKMEYQKLDTVIREQIPSGSQNRKQPHRYATEFPFEALHCYKHINVRRAMLSMGTLGGGNHFIEIDQEKGGKNIYAAVHSGSLHLGKEVAEYYLKEGQKRLREQGIELPYELTYLTGTLMEEYLHDQKIVQDFAAESRRAMLDELAKGMKWKGDEILSCVHNYIDLTGNTKILRKGAISVKDGEDVIIPINMKEGILVGIGMGNDEWNCSAPHGSGRVIKRSEVRNHYTVSSFKKEMKGIYSSCIGSDTLDEAPFAYRNASEINSLIDCTVTIQKRLLPLYNYKAGGYL